MFIWHTESQSWLNSLTKRQMYCTVARETKLTLGVVRQELPRRHRVRSSEEKDKICSKGWPFVPKCEVRDGNVWQLTDKSQGLKKKDFSSVCHLDYCYYIACSLLPAHKGTVVREFFCSSANQKPIIIAPCLNTNYSKRLHNTTFYDSDFTFHFLFHFWSVQYAVASTFSVGWIIVQGLTERQYRVQYSAIILAV